MAGPRGSRVHDAAGAWRLQQQLAALQATALSAPCGTVPAMHVLQQLGKVFASLQGAACASGSSGDSGTVTAGGPASAGAADTSVLEQGSGVDASASEHDGSRSSNDDASGLVAGAAVADGALLEAAAAQLRGIIAASAPGRQRFVASLVHAHLFLAWDVLQDALQPASTRAGSGSGGGGSSSCAAAGGSSNSSATAAAAVVDIEAQQDPWGPCAAWRINSRQYARLLHMLDMHALLLDALAWLPSGDACISLAPQAQLQQLLLASAAAAHPPVISPLLRLLRPAAAPESWRPGPLWALLLLALQHPGATEQLASPADRLCCLEQLAVAAMWAVEVHSPASWQADGSDTAAAPVGQQQQQQQQQQQPQQPQQFAVCARAKQALGGGTISAAGATDDAAGGAASFELARETIALLEQLLASWQDDVCAAAAAAPPPTAQTTAGGCAHCAQQLLRQLLVLKPLLQAHIAALFAKGQQHPGSSSGSTSQQWGVLQMQALVHLNTRATLLLMAVPEGGVAAEAGAATRGGELERTGGALAAQWQQLSDVLLQSQPAALSSDDPATGRGHQPWLALFQPASTSSNTGSGGSSDATCAWQLQMLDAGGALQLAGQGGHVSVSAPDPPCVVCALGSAADAAAAAAPPAAVALHPAWQPGDVVSHIAAWLAAWLSPGAPCWWRLATGAVAGAVGPGLWAPARLAAALLDMLAHCSGSDGSGELQFWPQLPPLLMHMLAAAASQVSDKKQQLALLSVAYGGTDGAAAVTAIAGGVRAAAAAAPASSLVQRCAALRKWVAAQGPLVVAAQRALVAASNRLAAHDEGGNLVVLTRQQQAALVADAGKALLPAALLWPQLMVRRLVADAIHHRGQQPLLVDLLAALAPAITATTAAGATDAAATAAYAGCCGGGGPVSLLLLTLQQALLPDCGSSAEAAAGAASGSNDGGEVLSASGRAAAVELVGRLVDAGLLGRQQALDQLVLAPLQALWLEWSMQQQQQQQQQQQVLGASGSSSSSSTWQEPGRLRMLMALAQQLMGLQGAKQGQTADSKVTGSATASGTEALAAAAPQACQCTLAWPTSSEAAAAAQLLRGAAGWDAALGLAAAGQLLEWKAREEQQPDYAGISQAAALLEAIGGMAQQRRPAAAAGAVPEEQQAAAMISPSVVQQLPWAARLALLPFLDAPQPAGSTTWALVQPASTGALGSGGSGGSGSSGGGPQLAHAGLLLLECLQFAASSVQHAQQLAAALSAARCPDADAAAPTLRTAGSTAQALARAALQLPGGSFRRGALLALGQALPFSSDAQGARLLLLGLPALVGAKLAATGSAPAPPGLQWQATLQLACRAVYLFVSQSRWARAAAGTAGLQLAAEHCFRGLTCLVLHALDGGADEGGALLPGMREVCQLVGALQPHCDAGALQPLLLQLLERVCGAPLQLRPLPPPAAQALDAFEGDMSAVAARGGSDADGWGGARTVAGTSYRSRVLGAAEQLALLPQPQRRLLAAAALHMVERALAAAGWEEVVGQELDAIEADLLHACGLGEA